MRRISLRDYETIDRNTFSDCNVLTGKLKLTKNNCQGQLKINQLDKIIMPFDYSKLKDKQKELLFVSSFSIPGVIRVEMEIHF